MKYCIDGRFVTRGFGGQERYSYEILAELDKIIANDEFELVVPTYAENVPVYQNIKLVRYGDRKSGFLWEQIDFWRYLRKSKCLGIYLCNTWPYFRPDISTIHDVTMLVLPNLYTNLYGKLSVLMHKALFKSAAHRSKLIFTISEYSRAEIERILHVEENRIILLGCGWQHFLRVKPDETVFDRHSEIKRGEYYLSASSITPHKNFKWVKESAKFNPSSIYAIAGKKVGLSVDRDDDTPSNLIYLGRVTDEEMKALMKHCEAFLHPAKSEGFGIPPIEAMSVGAPLIISNATCLPEIYEDSAHYIDPDDASLDLDNLLAEPVGDAKRILDRYSWEKIARKLYDALKQAE